MLTIMLVFGTVAMLAKWLSDTSPLGFWYSALIAVIVTIFAPLISVACSALLAYVAYVGGGDIAPNQLAAGALKTSILAMIAGPFFVAYYRRPPRSPARNPRSRCL